VLNLVAKYKGHTINSVLIHLKKITSYKDLTTWQKAMRLVSHVYKLSSSFPPDEKFGLTMELRRAAVSVPSNIPEGWGRETTKNYLQFLRISRGSLYEIETQLLIALDLKYTNDTKPTMALIVEVGKMLNTLINKLERTLTPGA
jgi:four helix bundle protein